MFFEEIRTGGCCSYVIACSETCAGVVVDPELSQIDRTLALAAKAGVRIHYVIDTGLAALFATQGLLPTAGLYLAFALLAAAGWQSWRRGRSQA